MCGTTDSNPHALTLSDALAALSSPYLLRYRVNEKTTVTKLPQPTANQKQILEALGVNLPNHVVRHLSPGENMQSHLYHAFIGEITSPQKGRSRRKGETRSLFFLLTPEPLAKLGSKVQVQVLSCTESVLCNC
jgi:hypothetical protein